MPIDMKKQIADAANRLLFEKNVKKLTVKDIVDECHISRQTFYYHFEDIPHLLEWILSSGLTKMKEETLEKKNMKERLRYFFLMSVQIQPYIKKTLGTNYGQELELLLKKEIYQIAEELVKEELAYHDLSYEQMSFLMRYHAQAVLGIMLNWTEKDNQNMDFIIDMTYQIMCGRMVFIPEEERT